MNQYLIIAISLLSFSSFGFPVDSNDFFAVYQTPNDTNRVNALNKLSYDLRVTDPDSAINVSIISEEMALSINYTNGVGDAKMRRGIANTSLGNYHEALDLLLEANEIFLTTGSKTRLAGCLNNIGRVYNFTENYDKALEYYETSANMFGDLNEIRRQGNILNNIGYIYKLRADYSQSLKYLFLSLNKAKETKDEAGLLYPLYNIGSVYLNLHQLDSSLIYLNTSLALARQYKDQYILSLGMIDLGNLYLEQGESTKALICFQEAFDVSDATGLKSEKREAAKYLSAAYERSNSAAKALKYYKIYKDTNDSLFNRDNTRKIAQIEAQYNYNQEKIKADNERRLIELEKEKELSNAIWIRNSLVVGLAFMLVILYLLYKNAARKNKANAILKKLNEQIQEQTEMLKKSNEEITTINENLEVIVDERTHELQQQSRKLKEYIHSNSHVVRAPLARILALTELYVSENEKDIDLNYITKNIQQSAQELDNVLRVLNNKLTEDKQ